jgi:undecaprenyl-diphosphatase
MLYDIQLQWILSLQEALRSPWMDYFFRAWNFVDTAYFALIVISLVWYLWDRRIGIRLFYILIMSLVLNKLLKDFFHQPRPCQIDPLVGLLCPTSPGFPSGAAQTAILLCGLVFIECQRVLYRYLAVAFALLLCFSRVYLGVHYPSDILGGLVVGSLLLLMYGKGFSLFKKIWKPAALSFPFLLLLLPPSLSLPLFFATLGVAAGLMTYEKCAIQKVKSLGRRGWQVFIVIGGLCLLFGIGYLFPRLGILWDFGRGYWLSFLGGWIGSRIYLFHLKGTQ